MARLRCFVVATLLLAGLNDRGCAATVDVSTAGKALQPLVIAEQASPATKAAAAELADYLGRITGAKFIVQTGDGTSGIAVGKPADFPAVHVDVPWREGDITQREHYLLRSHEKGAWLLGATDAAVEHAVWDFLHRLGYRQFFPGKTWEVVPKSPALAIAVDVHEEPAYHARRIWYGYGPWPENAQAYHDWCVRNRATSGIELRSGHAYDGIIHRNKAVFDAHPEYFGLVKGERKSSKLCISNPGLRKLVIEDALAQFAKDPSADSVSIEPSDGVGWCECDQCKALGSVSDRALTLANEVAAAVGEKYGKRFVGMYAYSEHSPPPNIRGHPQVVVGVATAFIRGGFSIDQLLAGWQQHVATLGIREYYSVNTWDRDLPGAARGGNLDYLRRTIPDFYSKGARFLSAESSDNWGPNGLGYYVASRMMWDVREAARTDDIVADFLDKSFGPAREPMSKFYQLLDGSKRQAMSDDLIGRMYRLLDEAKRKTSDPAMAARLNDLVLYTRYVDLYLDYSSSHGPARQAAFEQVIRHAWRMRGTMMVHTKALYRDLPNRDKSVVAPMGARWNVAESKNPWKQGGPFTAAELDQFVSSGIANRKLLDFAPVSFSDQLVPAARLALPDMPDGSAGIYSRGVRNYQTWIETAPATLKLQARAGLVYGSRGKAKVDFYPAAEPEMKSVAHVEVAPDKEEHPTELKTTFTGLHRIEVSDGAAGTNVTWPDGTPMTIVSSHENPATLHGRWSLYFYVPKGSKVVGGFASGEGKLMDGSGKLAHTFETKPGYFSVPVPAGEDGKLWKFQNSVGARQLMTVPPCLARNAKELLLPAEVVDKDTAH